MHCSELNLLIYYIDLQRRRMWQRKSSCRSKSPLFCSIIVFDNDEENCNLFCISRLLPPMRP